MNKSTAIALLIGKSVFGASLALGFFTSPAGNAATHTTIAAESSVAALDAQSPQQSTDHRFGSAAGDSARVTVTTRPCGVAIKGVCVR